jgi:hypothetical protein
VARPHHTPHMIGVRVYVCCVCRAVLCAVAVCRAELRCVCRAVLCAGAVCVGRRAQQGLVSSSSKVSTSTPTL